MRYILTLDVGTTAVKACLFTQTLALAGYSSEEYGLLTSGGTVELDPQRYWLACADTVRRAMRQAGATPDAVAAMAVTTQGETLIPVDRNGQALCDAVVWLDARASDQAQALSRALDPEKIYTTTGLPELTGQTPVCKLMWFRQRRPDIFEKTHKFLLLEDYLIYRLTGRFVTEMSLMTSTGYLDIRKGALWDEMLVEAGVRPCQIPQLLPSGVTVGPLTEKAAHALALCPGIPVVTGAMDQAASAIGAGNTQKGAVTETTGTALVVAATVTTPDFTAPQRLTVYRHAIEGRYLLLPFCPTAGIVLKWLKDTFFSAEASCAGQNAYVLLDEMARTAPAGCGGLTALVNFAGALTPELLPGAKGVFYGIGLDTGRSHFVRAVLEGVAYLLKDQVLLLERMGIPCQRVYALGGGARSDIWCQIKADVLGRPVCTTQLAETTSLGAAMLAGGAVGITERADSCRPVAAREYLPAAERVRVYQEGYGNYRALCRALAPGFR